MKALYFWILAGLVSTSLAAGVVSQKVMGQPDAPELPPGRMPDFPTPPSPPSPIAPLPKLPVPPKANAPQEVRPFPLTVSPEDVYPLPPPSFESRKLPAENGARQVQATSSPINPVSTPLPPSVSAPLPPPVPDAPLLPPVPNNAPELKEPLPPPLPASAVPGQIPGIREPLSGAEKKQDPVVEKPVLPTLPSTTAPLTEKEQENIFTTDLRPGKNEPSVSIEWVSPTLARLGQPIPCQILVRNTGSIPVHQVMVRHIMVQGVSHHQSEPAAAVEDRMLRWNLGTLEAGQSRRIDVQLVSQTRGPLACQATVTFTGASAMQLQVREPLLNLKVKGPDRVIADEPVTFLITLTNPGDGPTENIRLKVLLPEGLDHTRGRHFEVDAGQLAPKESRNMQMICQARGKGVQKVGLAATAEGNLSANETVQLEILQPKLDLVVNGPKLRFIDRHAVYALKVTNPGSAPANNVTLTEIVPAGFKFHAASGVGRFDENTRSVTWALGDVLPGQNREVNLELVALAAGDHKLVGQVVSARGVKTEAETKTRVEGLSSLLIEVVDVEDPVEVGAETAYELRVTNIGTKTETNLQLVCTLPEQVEFKEAKSATNQRFRVEGREVIFEPLAKLAPRADVIFRIQVRGTSPGNARFRAQVRADGLTEPLQRDEITRIYNDEASPK